MMLRIGKIRTGFTLLETLIVVAILAILIGLAIPNLGKSAYDIKLRDAASNLISLSNYARQRAVMEETLYRLNLNSSQEKYYLTYKDASANNFTAVEGRLGEVYTLLPGLDLESEKEFINFYPDGRADAASFSLTNKNGRRYNLITEPNLGTLRFTD